MVRVKTDCQVGVYEIAGKDVSPDRPFITVRSHWNDRDRVILVGPDGTSVTVVASDLAAAIGKASGGP